MLQEIIVFYASRAGKCLFHSTGKEKTSAYWLFDFDKREKTAFLDRVGYNIFHIECLKRTSFGDASQPKTRFSIVFQGITCLKRIKSTLKANFLKVLFSRREQAIYARSTGFKHNFLSKCKTVFTRWAKQ